jgi:hypothetical protein
MKNKSFFYVLLFHFFLIPSKATLAQDISFSEGLEMDLTPEEEKTLKQFDNLMEVHFSNFGPLKAQIKDLPFEKQSLHIREHLQKILNESLSHKRLSEKTFLYAINRGLFIDQIMKHNSSHESLNTAFLLHVLDFLTSEHLLFKDNRDEYIRRSSLSSLRFLFSLAHFSSKELSHDPFLAILILHFSSRVALTDLLKDPQRDCLASLLSTLKVNIDQFDFNFHDLENIAKRKGYFNYIDYENQLNRIERLKTMNTCQDLN